MDEAWRQRVRERAYAIWLREGSPDGSAEQFWLMAEEELLAEGQGPSSHEPAAVRATAGGRWHDLVVRFRPRVPLVNVGQEPRLGPARGGGPAAARSTPTLSRPSVT